MRIVTVSHMKIAIHTLIRFLYFIHFFTVPVWRKAAIAKQVPEGRAQRVWGGGKLWLLCFQALPYKVKMCLADHATPKDRIKRLNLLKKFVVRLSVTR